MLCSRVEHSLHIYGKGIIDFVHCFRLCVTEVFIQILGASIMLVERKLAEQDAMEDAAAMRSETDDFQGEWLQWLCVIVIDQWNSLL